MLLNGGSFLGTEFIAAVSVAMKCSLSLSLALYLSPSLSLSLSLSEGARGSPPKIAVGEACWYRGTSLMRDTHHPGITMGP